MYYENPFYILGVSPRDGKTNIIAASDKKSLSLDSNVCIEASSQLLNPVKRLKAEITWFIGISPKKGDEIISYLEKLKNGIESAMLDLNQFNAPIKIMILYNSICLKKDITDFDLCQWLLDIDTYFEALDFKKMMVDINEERVVSGFAKVEDDNIVEEVCRQLRNEITSMAGNKISQYDIYEYAKLVEWMMQGCIDENDEYIAGPIIEDMVGQYELNSRYLLENKGRQIKNIIEHTTKNIENVNIEKIISDLKKMIIDFDLLAQPLQLNARSKGIKHDESEHVAYLVRQFAVLLFNEYGLIDEATRITNMLNEVFSELPEFAQTVLADKRYLEDIAEEAELENIASQSTMMPDVTTKHKKNNGERPLWQALIIKVSIIAVIFIGLYAINGGFSGSNSKDEVLTPVNRPTNGEVYYDISGEGSSKPCVIEVIAADQDCVIKLVNVDTDEDELVFYVRANTSSTQEIDVGEYEMKCASGDTWYGWNDYFGNNTVATTMDENFVFKYGEGWTVTLTAATNGNLSDTPIDMSEF